ncbi:DNA-binding CsgD family transcriptional regulator/tetratricopeptide (TPR) repeat protein [Catenulispora sp. EB89]|uniref:AAA family ATPase n=1 Tax=Catenulispora sp. EB89 TaxID=3156257 RepID=UPI003511061B
MMAAPLRGRSKPMTRVLSTVRGAFRSGASAVVVVSGPGGIGKSALVNQACWEAAAMGARVVHAVCDPVARVSPGAPVIAALRAGPEPLVGGDEYERILRARDEPLLLGERIAAVLEAAAGDAPLVVAVDDLQQADRVSLFVIRTLMGRLIGLPVVWMFAAREEQAALALLGAQRCRVELVPLGPLAAADVTAIAMDRLGHAPDEQLRDLVGAAGGNPLLAVQILHSVIRAGTAGATASAGSAGSAGAAGIAGSAGSAEGSARSVPLEFTAVIAQRLAELSDATRDLAALIAVAGRPLPLRVVTALMPQLPDTGWETVLAEARDSGLVQAAESADAAGSALAPTHHLVSEAVCAALPEDTVRAWHLRLSRHYLHAAGDPFAAAVHVRAAVTIGDIAGAEVLLTAAEQLTAASPDDAADLAAEAFAAVTPDLPEWLGVGRRCLAVLRRTERADEAIAVADAILARVDDPDLAGAVEAQASSALWVAGRLEELLARTGRVLDGADPGREVAARLSAVRALAHTRLATGEDAAREASAALDLARASGDAEAVALALHAVGQAARNEGRHHAALRAFREVRTTSAGHHLAEEITSLQFLDRYDHAQTLLDEVRAAHGDTDGAILPALQCAQIWQDFNLGRGDEAEAGARALLEIGQQLGNGVYALDAAIVQISVALLRGDAVTAAALLDFAADLPGADAALRRPGLTVMRGWLAVARGDLSGATAALAPVAQGATRSCGYWPLWPCWMGLFYEVGTAADDQAFAQTVVDVAELAAERTPGVASFEGLALNVRARSKGDRELLRQSADILARSPRPLLRGFGADCLGRALLADGDRGAGLALLDSAWDHYHSADARVYRDNVHKVMREAGVRRAKWSTATPRPDTGTDALTEAERRVALLVAAGHSNRSAATELGVSVNTVGTHLRSAFAKLGVQSRVQLANVLHREPGALTYTGDAKSRAGM